jgi:hypothetical protein
MNTIEIKNAKRNLAEAKKTCISSEIDKASIKLTLEHIRHSLRSESISYGELAELQSLVEYIDKDDVELLEAAGVPES